MIPDFFTKLSAPEKKMLYLAVLAVFLFFSDSLFLRPLMSKIHTIENENKEKGTGIRNYNRYLDYADKIRQEEGLYAPYMRNEAKTEEEIIAGFLKTIELLASEVNITIVKLNPSEVIQKKGHTFYHADMECSGRLEDMVSFLHRIDSTQNLLKVVRMNVSGKKTSAEEVAASLRVAKLIVAADAAGNYEFTGEGENPEATSGSIVVSANATDAAAGKDGRAEERQTAGQSSGGVVNLVNPPDGAAAGDQKKPGDESGDPAASPSGQVSAGPVTAGDAGQQGHARPGGPNDAGGSIPSVAAASDFSAEGAVTPLRGRNKNKRRLPRNQRKKAFLKRSSKRCRAKGGRAWGWRTCTRFGSVLSVRPPSRARIITLKERRADHRRRRKPPDSRRFPTARASGVMNRCWRRWTKARSERTCGKGC